MSEERQGDALSEKLPLQDSSGAANVQSAVAPSYFDDPAKAALLEREARSWIGTPFRQYYQQQYRDYKNQLPPRLKGKGGGIDCVGLVQHIMWRVGAAPTFCFPRTAADYQPHQSGEKILDWMRGKVDDWQSEQLAQMFIELKIPDNVIDPTAPTPRDFFKPGDICVLRHGSLFHLPIIIDNDLHFVNALPRAGVIEGTIQDATYSKHLVAVFRLKG